MHVAVMMCWLNVLKSQSAKTKITTAKCLRDTSIVLYKLKKKGLSGGWKINFAMLIIAGLEFILFSHL